MRIHLWPPTPLNKPGLSLAARGFPLARQHSSIAIKFNSGDARERKQVALHALVHTWSEKKGAGFPANENASLNSTSSPPPLNEENQKLIAPHCVTPSLQVSYGLNSVPASVNCPVSNCTGRFCTALCYSAKRLASVCSLIGCFWW